jgi:hypothetical protein
MDATRIIGLLSTVVIVGFLIFALRLGLREKRDKRPD